MIADRGAAHRQRAVAQRGRHELQLFIAGGGQSPAEAGHRELVHRAAQPGPRPGRLVAAQVLEPPGVAPGKRAAIEPVIIRASAARLPAPPLNCATVASGRSAPAATAPALAARPMSTPVLLYVVVGHGLRMGRGSRWLTSTERSSDWPWWQRITVVTAFAGQPGAGGSGSGHR
ncbi:MAG: hypothetical protein IPI49_33270 [Myxococcales bacterium]|nr:hypothetical protein [Myxococcales bacterium]